MPPPPPLTLLEASARRVARHYDTSRVCGGMGDQERIYAKLRSFAKTMPQRASGSVGRRGRGILFIVLSRGAAQIFYCFSQQFSFGFFFFATCCVCVCVCAVVLPSCVVNRASRWLSLFIRARYSTVGEGAGGVAQGKREVPVAPRVLAEAAEAAMHSGDNEWARREAVSDLLAADIVYNTMDGKRVLGRESVIDKMNDTMVRGV